jgi:bacterioferritin
LRKDQLIAMLNRNLADEHAAVLRYLIHGYLEGEDTPVGASLLSRSREEMWHMHWLGMIVGQLGGEPNMVPAEYPLDPTNRDSIFKSYVEYEKKLIPHYHQEAESVDDPHIKRVLEREGWESEIHAEKFQKIRDNLSPEQSETLPDGQKGFPQEFVDRLQLDVQDKYMEMIRLIRDSWFFQDQGIIPWRLMDFAMTQMKHLAHMAEEVGGNGIEPRLEVITFGKKAFLGLALKKMFEVSGDSFDKIQNLLSLTETKRHPGLIMNLELALKQETYEREEIEEWLFHSI